MAKFSREIEVRGHLIDSSILTKIFDRIMDVDGEFEVLEINIGKKPHDILNQEFYPNVIDFCPSQTTLHSSHHAFSFQWIDVENTMMDKCIVFKGKQAFCVPIRDVKKGDKIVVGESGVKITPPTRPREGVNVFEFIRHYHVFWCFL